MFSFQFLYFSFKKKKKNLIKFFTLLIYFSDIAIATRSGRSGAAGQSLRRAETHIRILHNFEATSSDDNYGKIVIYVRTVLARARVRTMKNMRALSDSTSSNNHRAVPRCR